jgi:hypothetical protein
MKVSKKDLAKLSKQTGLSGALLFYAMKFGMIGIVGRKPKNTNQ